MPNPPVQLSALSDRIVQIRVQWVYSHQSGGESSWSFWVRSDVPDPLNFTLDSFGEAALGYFCSARPRTWQVERIRAEDRFPQTLAAVIVTPDPEIVGNPDEPGSSPVDGPVISWRTDNPGRSYRGRTYWGPIQRKDLTEEDVEGDADEAVSLFAEQMVFQFGPAVGLFGPRFCIVSEQHDGVLGPPFFYTPVTTYLYNSNTATMRRRNGVWRNLPY